MKSNDVRCTPKPLVREIADLVGVSRFTLDVAASPGNAVCDEYYSLEEYRNAFDLTWKGHVFVNPPFSQIGRWVVRAWDQHRCGSSRSITMLLPANKTEQPWWSVHVEGQKFAQFPQFKIHFLAGRRRFLMPDGSPIYARDTKGEFRLNAKGEKIVGSPGFGLVVLSWRNE